MWNRASKFVFWRPATPLRAGRFPHLRAVAVIIAAVILGLFFNIHVHMSVPVVLLFILTSACAWYGGTAAGLTALIVSLPAVYFFSFDPLHATRPSYPDDLLEVLLFVALSLFTILAIEKLRRAQARADHALMDLAAREEQYRTIVETAGYAMAWVGYAEPGARGQLRVVARVGEDPCTDESAIPPPGGLVRSPKVTERALRSGLPVARRVNAG
jgi:hypothetical protein